MSDPVTPYDDLYAIAQGDDPVRAREAAELLLEYEKSCRAPQSTADIDTAPCRKTPLAFWQSLTDGQRHELAASCCKGCGSLDTSCKCWNDE